MKRPLAAAVVAVAFMGGCSVSTDTRATTVDDGEVPFSLLDRKAPPVVTTRPGRVGEPVSLCFLRDGRLVRVERELDPSVSLELVLAALSLPPEDQVVPARTALGNPLVVRGVDVVAGIARVDLGPAISELAGEDQLLAVAQIVCTLTTRPGVGQVSFTLEGTPIEVPRGDGSLTAQPVSRDDYAGLLAV